MNKVYNKKGNKIRNKKKNDSCPHKVIMQEI